MKIFVWMMALGATMMLSGCSTGVEQRSSPRIAAAPVPAASPIPYRWTHGHSEKAHKAMLATFGRGGLPPGQFVWASKVPAEGETRVVVDLISQMAYVFRGDIHPLRDIALLFESGLGEDGIENLPAQLSYLRNN